jgi:hypothetical protein
MQTMAGKVLRTRPKGRAQRGGFEASCPTPLQCAPRRASQGPIQRLPRMTKSPTESGPRMPVSNTLHPCRATHHRHGA